MFYGSSLKKISYELAVHWHNDSLHFRSPLLCKFFKCFKYIHQDLYTIAIVKPKRLWAMQLFSKVLSVSFYLKPALFSYFGGCGGSSMRYIGKNVLPILMEAGRTYLFKIVWFFLNSLGQILLKSFLMPHLTLIEAYISTTHFDKELFLWA